LYLGMMDSTIAEGFEDDKVKEKKWIGLKYSLSLQL
jgi:hypothetical protein